MSLQQFLKSDGINREAVSEETPLPVAVISGGAGGGTLAATATEAAPTYTEGQDDAPLSMDLDGNLRVIDVAVAAAVAAVAAILGEVQASPTVNTVGDRLKTLNTAIADIAADQLPASLGTKAAALSLGATLSTENTAQLEAIMNSVGDTGTVNVAQDTAAIMNGATALTPKFAAISSTDDGDTVALVSGKKIRVLSMYFVVGGATTVKFQSGASTDKTGAMPFAANGGISLPFNPVGWFETTAGEKLNHVLSNAVAIAGGLTYIEV